jgi:hypothetical protein
MSHFNSKGFHKTVLAAALFASTGFAHSADLEVTVQNLTQGIYFTPILVSAHSNDASLFELGESASSELQAMAEGGDISGLVSTTQALSANNITNPAEGLLGPTMSTTASVTVDEGNDVLSIVAMMLPTNDGFIGLDNWAIPDMPGTYTIYLNAYDAGTEANDEVRGSGAPGEAGLPVPPPLEDLVGNDGAGITATITNASVHIHPGNIGDDDATAGISDIDNTVQRWLNPVAKVTVVVSE